MSKFIQIPLSFVAIVYLAGCTATGLYDAQAEEKLSVAKAQRDLKAGMSSAEVIQVMGSPNIISTDAQYNEVWVYDKISTQEAHQNASGGISILLAGVSGSSGSSVRSQRTLTVIVKFDKDKRVRDVSYHTSSF